MRSKCGKASERGAFRVAGLNRAVVDDCIDQSVSHHTTAAIVRERALFGADECSSGSGAARMHQCTTGIALVVVLSIRCGGMAIAAILDGGCCGR
ncbi:MAG: hypothetical protein BWZ07_01931 [Alphaproteobacteria bacterium ADurb.BinA280]|nr:MAG: hypothetical protein BWZ07_01931 [Alphaproteobacteria bacterium ADurb.BinA280]